MSDLLSIYWLGFVSGACGSLAFLSFSLVAIKLSKEK